MIFLSFILVTLITLKFYFNYKKSKIINGKIVLFKNHKPNEKTYYKNQIGNNKKYLGYTDSLSDILLNLMPAYNKVNYAIGRDKFNRNLRSALVLSLSINVILLLISTNDDISIVLSILSLIIPIGFSLIYSWLKYIMLRQKLIENLPSTIDIMVSVLKSGHSLNEALLAALKESHEPLKQELEQVIHKLNFGLTFNQALEPTCINYDCHELTIIKSAIKIQSELGGSLADILNKTNHSLKLRLNLANKVKVLTSQSKLTAIIVGVIPFILCVALELIHPSYLSPLITTDTGHILLCFAVTSLFLGIFTMLKMSWVKI